GSGTPDRRHDVAQAREHSVQDAHRKLDRRRWTSRSWFMAETEHIAEQPIRRVGVAERCDGHRRTSRFQRTRQWERAFELAEATLLRCRRTSRYRPAVRAAQATCGNRHYAGRCRHCARGLHAFAPRGKASTRATFGASAIVSRGRAIAPTAGESNGGRDTDSREALSLFRFAL